MKFLTASKCSAEHPFPSQVCLYFFNTHEVQCGHFALFFSPLRRRLGTTFPTLPQARASSRTGDVSLTADVLLSVLCSHPVASGHPAAGCSDSSAPLSLPCNICRNDSLVRCLSMFWHCLPSNVDLYHRIWAEKLFYVI